MGFVIKYHFIFFFHVESCCNCTCKRCFPSIAGSMKTSRWPMYRAWSSPMNICWYGYKLLVINISYFVYSDYSMLINITTDIQNTKQINEIQNTIKDQTTLMCLSVALLVEMNASQSHDDHKVHHVYSLQKMCGSFLFLDNADFRLLVKTLELKYFIPSSRHFSQTIMPAIYRETKTEVL